MGRHAGKGTRALIPALIVLSLAATLPANTTDMVAQGSERLRASDGILLAMGRNKALKDSVPAGRAWRGDSLPGRRIGHDTARVGRGHWNKEHKDAGRPDTLRKDTVRGIPGSSGSPAEKGVRGFPGNKPKPAQGP